jgi:serine/threonine protein kinase
VRSVLRDVKEPALRRSIDTMLPPAGYVVTETLDKATGERSRYTLTRLHGQGGLGRVWVARDGDLNREVALKEIRPERADHARASRRLLHEAQVTGQLEHPNIVPVYELARRPEDDQPFYTMRLIRGKTLREAIDDDQARRRAGRADPLDRHRLLQAFVGICQAIGHAHARGVLHRDLKPENVVIGP